MSRDCTKNLRNSSTVPQGVPLKEFQTISIKTGACEKKSGTFVLSK